ncbi:alpha/beta hydrolase [Cryptosporangium minutisporangium]|uniref:DUF1023 domain-containing protein n=1 Tax=Cryptosporangium minutisporangium TaxID=113569 RepID=A0ABP6SST7_9ACTN
MVELDDLRDARLSAVESTGAAWRKLAVRFKVVEDDAVSDLIGPLHHHSRWEGTAAQAAYRHLDGVNEGFGLLAEQARAVGALIDAAASRFATLQRQLDDLEQEARAAGARVRADGSVEPPYLTATESADDLSALAAARRNNETAQAFADRVAAVLAEATRLDEEYASALTRYIHPPSGVMSPSEVLNAARDAKDNAKLLGADKSTIPEGKSAWTINEWWQGLTADQRQAYLTAYPAELGRLNGIPAVDRNAANRAQLHRHLAEVEQKATEFGSATDQGWRDRVAHDRRTTERLLQRLEESEYGTEDTPVPLYLLGYAPGAVGNPDAGRAIVAVGNPDTATHVTTFVPGVATDMDDVPGLMLNRAIPLQVEADSLTPSVPGDVSVIAWLDYDAPENFQPWKPGGEGNLSLAGHERADQGAARLDAFLNGLHATHQGEGHYTALGHSYGSTVVGTAASSGDGLAVDDIIAAGSPGMRVAEAGDLNLDRNHVWAGAAPDDPIVNWTADSAHGVSPANPEFGANRFHVDTHGHGNYWMEGSTSLRNQAAVVTGQYDLLQQTPGALDHTSDEGWNYRQARIRGESVDPP